MIAFKMNVGECTIALPQWYSLKVQSEGEPSATHMAPSIVYRIRISAVKV